ncbi:MAG: GNAT family N-acetyltransferase [Candidatus Thiodiazotropha sp.]
MPENVCIRVARPADLDAMVRLLSQLFALEQDFEIDPQRQRSGLELLLGSETAQGFVAEVSGQVIAMVTVQRVISTAEGGVVAWVEDLVVDQNWRGQGIGSTLLRHLQDWCAASNISRLQLVADRDNRPALEFYRQEGWCETNLKVLRYL